MLAAGLVLGAGLGRVRERCGKQAGAPCVTRGAVQGSSTPLVPAQDILSSDGKVSVEGCSVLDIQDWDGGEEGTGRLSEALSKQDHQVVALHLSGNLALRPAAAAVDLSAPKDLLERIGAGCATAELHQTRAASVAHCELPPRGFGWDRSPKSPPTLPGRVTWRNTQLPRPRESAYAYPDCEESSQCRESRK